MNGFLTFIIAYVVGALFIQAFCVKVIVNIPLLDQYALAIRNCLCVLWLIILIISSIFSNFSGSTN